MSTLLPFLHDTCIPICPLVSLACGDHLKKLPHTCRTRSIWHNRSVRSVDTVYTFLRDCKPGAQKVILAMLAKPRIVKLILGHNDLRDEGVIAIFAFLTSSEQGRRIALEEIAINKNQLGDKSLEIIGAYLIGNVTLKSLFLQNVRHFSLAFFE